MRIIPRIIAAGTLLLAASGFRTAPPLDSADAFARLKTLTGTWESTLRGKPSFKEKVTYSMMAAETILLEDIGANPGGGHMLTAYHMDGNRLMLTHYCTAGNQPRMRLTAVDSTHVAFEIFDVTNLRSPDAYRSTKVDVRFLGKDRVDLVYEGLSAGKTSEQVFQLTRVP